MPRYKAFNDDGLEQIDKEFYEGLKTLRNAKINMPVKVDPGSTKRTIEEIINSLESIVMEALEEFMTEELIPQIAKQFDGKSRNVAEHSLYYIKSSEDPEPVIAGRDAGRSEFLSTSSDFARGFYDLRKRLTKAQPIKRQNGTVIKSLGEGANNMDIADYGPLGSQGGTLYSNWFLAVELGTGVQENTGAWMRDTGRTKDPTGDGSWWLPGEPGKGTRVLGQKGFHIFWEKDRRAPRQFWDKFIFEGFPNKLREKLKARFPTIFR